MNSCSNIEYEDKVTSAAEAISKVQSGDKVFIGSACATPATLVKALASREKQLDDVVLLHFLTGGDALMESGLQATGFRHKVFFVGTDTREAAKEGRAEYVPISFAQVPRLLTSGKLSVDVALIQVSPPDEHGYVSLGVSVDLIRDVIRNALTVIAEINPNMPRTLGDSFVHVDAIDHLVMVDVPVIEYVHAPADNVAEQIARYVARIIDDGSTLHIGLGQIPNEMLKYLTNRKDLGIHSDVITSPIVDLIEKGVITGQAKSSNRGQIVASYCIGTKRLYDLIDNNPMFSFQRINHVCDPAVIAGNHKMVSVTQAFAVDLTGQICADQFRGEFYGGVSTQPEFLRGAAESQGGKPIICLASTTEKDGESRILPLLREGEGVTIPRSDVHYVVTEYGSAYLFGKTVRERALALIEIAHPSFREWLLTEGKRLGYLREDQTLQSKVAYPSHEERRMTLKNGKQVVLRPSRASDTEGVKNLFYHLKPQDIYTRFFSRLTSLSVSRTEHLCNVDYESEMAFMAVVGSDDDEQIVGSSCYYVDQTTNLAEVAYMILPEWQSTGLGTALQTRMTEYAISKELNGFTADVLSSNAKMIDLARKSYDVSMKLDSGVYEVTMLFPRSTRITNGE
ncbi:MAG: GNAT family N-acetyltransferase [Deltaproteobacteria bacterium]|nr:GNAT family N-acetyltransferase [Deltaproteobacteria bacterium]